MTKDEVLAAIIRGLPYSSHISEIDTTSEERAIRFTWRRDRFRVSLAGSLGVEQVDDGFLSGSNLAIAVEALIRRAWIEGANKDTRP